MGVYLEKTGGGNLPMAWLKEVLQKVAVWRKQNAFVTVPESIRENTMCIKFLWGKKHMC